MAHTPLMPGWWWYRDGRYDGPVHVAADPAGLLHIDRVCHAGPPAPWPIGQPVTAVPGQWLPIVALPG